MPGRDHADLSATGQVADRSDERRFSYDLLRLICIAGVVAIHTFGAMAADPDALASGLWFPAALLSSGFVWVVPVFVMLSGALTLTPRAHRGGPAAFLRRRALRLVPALIAWTLIYLVGVRLVFNGERPNRWDLAAMLADGYVYPHLYFLYLIAGLSFVAPVLAAFLHAGDARRARILGGVLTAFTVVVFIVPGVLALGGYDRNYPLGMLTYWMPYVGFFVLGYAVSITTFRRRTLAGLAILGLLSWALVLFQVSPDSDTPLLDAFARPDYQGSTVAVLSIAAFAVGSAVLDRLRPGDRARRVVATLSDAAFGVYLVHLIVLLIPYQLLPGFADRTSFPQAALAYVVILAVSFPLVILARRVPVLRAIF